MPAGKGLHTVSVPIASLHREASLNSALDTQLLGGTDFDVDEIEQGWAKGRSLSPVKTSSYAGYEGYLPVADITKKTDDPTHIITALCAPVFKTADIKSGVVAMWPMNVLLKGRSAGNFVKSAQGYIHRRHIRELSETPEEHDFVSIAERYIGRPYIWAGVSAIGLDCSGLVQTSLRAVGRDAPRDSGDQAKIGDEIAEGSPLRRGDLIFWKGHVGIMQDAARLLHANAYHMAVESEPLDMAIARITQNYGPVTTRRRLKSV